MDTDLIHTLIELENNIRDIRNTSGTISECNLERYRTYNDIYSFTLAKEAISDNVLIKTDRRLISKSTDGERTTWDHWDQ